MMVSDTNSELETKFTSFQHLLDHTNFDNPTTTNHNHSNNNNNTTTSPPQNNVFLTSSPLSLPELDALNSSSSPHHHNTNNPFTSGGYYTPPVSPLTEKLLVLSGGSPSSPKEMLNRYSLNLEDLQNRGRYSQSIRSRSRKPGQSNDMSSIFSFHADTYSLDKSYSEPVPSLPCSPTDIKFTSLEPTEVRDPRPSEPPQPNGKVIKQEASIDSALGTSSSLQIFAEPETEVLLPARLNRSSIRRSTRRSSRRFNSRMRASVGGDRPTSTVLPSYATLTPKDGQVEADPQEGARPTMKRNQTIFESTVRRRTSIKRPIHGRSMSVAGANIKRNNAYEQVTSWEEAKSSWKQLRWNTKKANKRNQLDDDDDKVLIGTRVGEGHVNYALMYNMLTGIRVSVSRCSANPMTTLTSSDFRAAKKLAFDTTGNELVPSSKYDFKFKDYAPDVFRQIRSLFGLDPAEYLMSLTHKYIVSELFSPGKSKSFFYYSRDYRFIIKTIHHVEHRFLRKILPRYFQYIKDNPNTLLTRIYGLHRVKIPYSSKIHFVVMANLFSPDKDIHESYDLKGSTLGRKVDEDSLGPNSLIPMKDLNWLEKERQLQLGPTKRKVFLDQLEKDAKLLSALKIMDYSLLVGVHHVSRGQEQRHLDRTLSVIQPRKSPAVYSPGHLKDSSFQRTCATESNLTESLSQLSDAGQPHPNHSIFYQEQGGFFSTDELDTPGDTIYYMGIIDILTPYNYAKKIEHRWKSLQHDKNAISAVHPRNYAQRFLTFLRHSLPDATDSDDPPTPTDAAPLPRLQPRRLTVRRKSLRNKKMV